MEYRIKDVQLHCDAEGTLKVGGYINVTERESEMLYNKKNGKWFKEIMRRGVFSRAINCSKNIPLLFEHDWNKQLATTENCTLTLAEDNIGLKFDAIINDNQIYEQVRAGIINSCSFGFRALEQKIEPINARLEKRIVSAIELMEVSLVKNPAYVGSLAETRAYEEEEKETNPAVEPETNEEKEPETTIDESKEEVVKEPETQEEERFAGEEVAPEEEAQVIDKDYIQALVDELVQKKLEEVKAAEVQEQVIEEQILDVKEYHEEIEKDMQLESMKKNAEVIKLRLELLKLKHIKENI